MMGRFALIVFILSSSLTWLPAQGKARQPAKVLLVQNQAEPTEEEIARMSLRPVDVKARRLRRLNGPGVVGTETISRTEIEASGSRNLAELLEKQPGMAVVQTISGADLQMQGLDSRYVLLTRNGERLNGRINGVLDLSRFQTDAIEKVEIKRGPAEARYGSEAMAGVINLVTRETSGTSRLQTDNRTGTLGSAETRNFAEMPVGGGTVKVAAAWLYREPFRRNPDSLATNLRGINDRQVAMGWSQQNKNHRVDLEADYGLRDLTGTDVPGTGAVLDRLNRTETSQIMFVHRYKDAGSASRLGASWSRFYDQFLYDQRGDTALDSNQLATENLYQFGGEWEQMVGSHNRVAFGAEGVVEDLSTVRIDPPTAGRRRYSGFLQDEIRPFANDTWIISAGMRYDDDSRSRDILSPRFGMSFRDGTSTYRISYGRGFRVPSFRELFLLFENAGAGYRVLGNPLLRPEISDSLNATAEWALFREYNLFANAFYNELQDLIQAVTVSAAPGNTLFQYVNVSRARTAGLESMFSFPLADSWRGELGYMYTDTLNRDTGQDLEGRARHRANVGMRRTAGRWRFMVRSVYTGERPFTDPSAPGGRFFSPGFFALDTRLDWVWNTATTLYAGIDNILDTGDDRFNILLGRQFFMGGRVMF